MNVNHAVARWPITLAACAILVLAGFYIWTKHQSHLLGAIPWLLALACPIIHLLMHRDHGGHRGHDHRGQASS